MREAWERYGRRGKGEEDKGGHAEGGTVERSRKRRVEKVKEGR